MEILADKGNGNFAYMDNMQEAEKTLAGEFSSTMFTIAKDVKIQNEFKPPKVQSYRLVEYKNRQLANEDFNNDTFDVGEVGADCTVTALYEIIPIGVKNKYTTNIDDLKCQSNQINNSKEIANVKVPYKLPIEDTSFPFEQAVIYADDSNTQTPENVKFTSSVTTFGKYLSGSKYTPDLNVSEIISIASNAKQNDDDGYKAEFIRLLKLSTSL